MYERVDAEGSLSADSKSNENEATLVERHVTELVRVRDSMMRSLIWRAGLPRHQPL
jgi:hypothetical protein